MSKTTQVKVIDKPEVSELEVHNRDSICNLVDWWDGVCNVTGSTGTDKIMRTLYAKWHKSKSEMTFEDWCSDLAKPFGERCARILKANHGLDMAAHETERRFGEDCPQNVLKAFKWAAGLLGSPTGHMKEYKLGRQGERREVIISRLFGS